MANLFIGWTQAQLEAELASLQKELATGASVVSASGPSNSTTVQRERTIEGTIRKILRALNAIDPVTYPPTCYAQKTLVVLQV